MRGRLLRIFTWQNKKLWHAPKKRPFPPVLRHTWCRHLCQQVGSAHEQQVGRICLSIICPYPAVPLQAMTNFDPCLMILMGKELGEGRVFFKKSKDTNFTKALL